LAVWIRRFPQTKASTKAKNVADAGVTLAIVAATGGIGIAAIARAPFVLDFMRTVDIPDSWPRKLGIVKVAGALGLLAGMRMKPLGVAGIERKRSRALRTGKYDEVNITPLHHAPNGVEISQCSRKRQGRNDDTLLDPT
jgi:hypothetical protein